MNDRQALRVARIIVDRLDRLIEADQQRRITLERIEAIQQQQNERMDRMNQAVQAALTGLESDANQVVQDLQAHVDGTNQDSADIVTAIGNVRTILQGANQAFLAATAPPAPADPTPAPAPTTPSAATLDPTTPPVATTDPAAPTSTDAAPTAPTDSTAAPST